MSIPRRSMTILSMLVSLALIVTCTSAPSSATAAGDARPQPQIPPPQTPNCEFLQVLPTSASGQPISVPDGGVACDHGSFVGTSPSSSNVSRVLMEQSDVFGPDCNVTFNVGNSTYVIRVQQDFCLAEAGDVNASVISGNATITSITEGSVALNTMGTVNVTLN